MDPDFCSKSFKNFEIGWSIEFLLFKVSEKNALKNIDILILSCYWVRNVLNGYCAPELQGYTIFFSKSDGLYWENSSSSHEWFSGKVHWSLKFISELVCTLFELKIPELRNSVRSSFPVWRSFTVSFSWRNFCRLLRNNSAVTFFEKLANILP